MTKRGDLFCKNADLNKTAADVGNNASGLTVVVFCVASRLVAVAVLDNADFSDLVVNGGGVLTAAVCVDPVRAVETSVLVPELFVEPLFMPLALVDWLLIASVLVKELTGGVFVVGDTSTTQHISDLLLVAKKEIKTVPQNKHSTKPTTTSIAGKKIFAEGLLVVIFFLFSFVFVDFSFLR